MISLTGGAVLAYGITGSALASTGAVVEGLGFGAATMGSAGATSFDQARQLLQAQQMRVGEGSVNINKALETVRQAHKGGETLAGHALQKLAGRNPNIWGSVKGGAEQINQQAMKHINDIINGSGEFKIFTTDRGVQFWEKMLPDGRGLRLNLDGTFKGFIDQIK
ncbi:hypothetical protein AALB39_28350 [Lachnospiraceae bacterium 54-53]